VPQTLDAPARRPFRPNGGSRVERGMTDAI